MVNSQFFNEIVSTFDIYAEPKVPRAKAARKPAAKKAANPPPEKRKVDARTRRFMDALLGLKLK